MLDFIEKIAELLLPTQSRRLELHELRVHFVKNRKSILSHLKLCKRSHGIVGIYAARLGKGMFLGTVTSVYQDVIALKPLDDNDLTGKTIMIPIEEISSICPFNQLYEREAELEDAVEDQRFEHARLAHAN